jgi:hypothetical protein
MRSKKDEKEVEDEKRKKKEEKRFGVSSSILHTMVRSGEG